MRIMIGSDHAGYELKEKLRNLLAESGHPVSDFGSESADPVDYPDIAARVARSVVGTQGAMGILVCGTGTGMAIAANKIPGVRAAVCSSVPVAHAARSHNDANVLALGARIISEELAAVIVRCFLETPFEGGRHARRVEKIRALESDGQR
ncbi:MAG: ribose 5-phosphate isomerase B [Syntrophomonadaceae bacterium]|nr:ribose 5-phosphate isomerase B [Syntrophomonadaceae bacterium]MDH7497152.1 ribose 5-phosphate isomerase B [Syntrophomonadaceae bacterium]